MNRLHHLKTTLMQNFLNNVNYPAVELLLLNYNSGDDLEEWAYANFGDYMDTGIFNYYKTLEPQVFSHSHSKNLAFRLADGDIVCNINADNYIGPGFASYINEAFHANDNVFLAPDHQANINGGASGIVCVKKSDFYKVGGFDERMKVYGWEDVDFTNRLQHAGLEKKLISDGSLIGAFSHSEDEKYDKEKLQREIHSIYADCRDPAIRSAVKLFVLYADKTFKTGTIVNNLLRSAEDEDFERVHKAKTFFRFTYELEDRYWRMGQWIAEGDKIRLSGPSVDPGSVFYRHDKVGDVLKEKYGDEMVLYNITDRQTIDRIAFNIIEYDNRMIMLDNFHHKATSLSQENFGQAMVFKNFVNDTGMMVR